MNKTIKEILIGMLLGDGHIRRSGLNKAYITFEQSSKKKEYFSYVETIFKKEGFNISESQTYERMDPRYEKSTSSIRFTSKVTEELKPLADMFLDEEGKKKIPSNIGDYLTVKSLAHWIMDDGQQVKRGGVTLCTDSYKSEEISILRKALQDNFSLITSIHRKKNNNESNLPYERIYVNKESLDNIKEDLKVQMHSSMFYKLNLSEDSSESNENTSVVSNLNTKNTDTKNKIILDTISDMSDIGSDVE